MKSAKHLLLGLFLFACFQSASAQGLGIRGGYNFSTVSGGNKYINDIGSNNGYYIGVFKELPFLVKDALYLVPELQYSKQGFSTASSNIDLNYINIPILAKLYLVKIISLETGPQFGFNVSQSGSSTYNYNTLDTAWAAGLSINLPFRLSISGRYVGSFNEVVKDSGSKNQIFQAGLAYKFK